MILKNCTPPQFLIESDFLKIVICSFDLKPKTQVKVRKFLQFFLQKFGILSNFLEMPTHMIILNEMGNFSNRLIR